MLIFTDRLKSSRNGYDRWEGFTPDGGLHYTGAGRRGNQTFSDANRLLASTGETNKPVYVCESSGTMVTFIGVFRLAKVPYRFELAPDRDGKLRKVIVFHLWPAT
jgi:hypothetical protein